MTGYAEMISIHHINFEGTIVKNDVTYHFFKYGKRQLLLPFRVHRFLNSLNPDIVIVHGLIFPWQVLLLSMQIKGNVKFFAVHHAERPLRFPKSLLQMIADRAMNGYFFSSSALGQAWVEKKQISDLKKVHEVMLVSSFFQPTKQAGELATLAKTYLWVGRLDSNKDPITLVKAFIEFLQNVPDAVLYLIYRGGDLRNKVDTLISDAKVSDHIIVKEDVDHEELLNWYNNAAFIISTSHYEGGGTALSEGMSCGCIPIVTSIPSFRMMTSNGSVGFLFQTGDVKGLYNVLNSSAKIDFMKEREKVLEQFRTQLSLEAISKKMLKVIAES
jgi:glycosyltransferase involved in cell wall biosynthesis